MNRQEHLLTIVGEECAEVHQSCSKALRFGLQDAQPGQNLTNESRILQEFNDLVAVIEMLFGCPIKNIISTSEVLAKKAKVEKYLSYSEGCGTLTPTDTTLTEANEMLKNPATVEQAKAQVERLNAQGARDKEIQKLLFRIYEELRSAEWCSPIMDELKEYIIFPIQEDGNQ